MSKSRNDKKAIKPVKTVYTYKDAELELQQIQEELESIGPSLHVFESLEKMSLLLKSIKFDRSPGLVGIVTQGLSQRKQNNQKKNNLKESIHATYELALTQLASSINEFWRQGILDIPESEYQLFHKPEATVYFKQFQARTVFAIRYINFSVHQIKSNAERILAIDRWCYVMDKCLASNNFDATWTIYTAIASDANLKYYATQANNGFNSQYSLEYLSESAKNALANAKKYFEGHGCFERLKNECQRLQDNAIPYTPLLTLHARDLASNKEQDANARDRIAQEKAEAAQKAANEVKNSDASSSDQLETNLAEKEEVALEKPDLCFDENGDSEHTINCIEKFKAKMAVVRALLSEVDYQIYSPWTKDDNLADAMFDLLSQFNIDADQYQELNDAVWPGIDSLKASVAAPDFTMEKIQEVLNEAAFSVFMSYPRENRSAEDVAAELKDARTILTSSQVKFMSSSTLPVSSETKNHSTWSGVSRWLKSRKNRKRNDDSASEYSGTETDLSSGNVSDSSRGSVESHSSADSVKSSFFKPFVSRDGLKQSLRDSKVFNSSVDSLSTEDIFNQEMKNLPERSI